LPDRKKWGGGKRVKHFGIAQDGGEKEIRKEGRKSIRAMKKKMVFK